MLSLRARVNLGVTAMKGYSAFCKVPTLLFYVISRNLVKVCLIPRQKCSRCILQPQSTGLMTWKTCIRISISMISQHWINGRKYKINFFTHTETIYFMHSTDTRKSEKNTKTYTNRENTHMIFYEQEVSESCQTTGKDLVKIEGA